MTEVGTLKELGVGVGDVVECVGWSYSDNSGLGVYTGLHWKIYENHPQGYCEMCAVCKHGYTRIDEGMLFRIISRANKPKLWRDMTPEEKGALLLAAHEGKVIEEFTPDINGINRRWLAWYPQPKIMNADLAYRIKPQPKVDTVTVHYQKNGATVMPISNGYTHRITFQTIDGKPDCASVNMAEL